MTARELTGVGFFTTLAVADASLAVPGASTRAPVGDVVATIAGLQHGAGFVLFLEHGLLQMLEGYTYDEPWPEHTDKLSL